MLSLVIPCRMLWNVSRILRQPLSSLCAPQSPLNSQNLISFFLITQLYIVDLSRQPLVTRLVTTVSDYIRAVNCSNGGLSMLYVYSAMETHLYHVLCVVCAPPSF